MNPDTIPPDLPQEPDPETLYLPAPGMRQQPERDEWALIRYIGQPVGELIILREGATVLGRATDCEIYLPDGEVSRRHSCVERLREEAGQDRVFVRDLGSTNGTYVNGQRMARATTPQELHPGDVVRVGGHAFKLKRLDSLERHYHDAILVQTTTDLLTGVSNRATILAFLEKQFDLTRRHRRPLSVVLCDLDHFKHINDNYGHAAGDEVLRRFGNVMLDRLRASDHVGRIGGEEFLLILPETSVREATNVAEELRQLVAKDGIHVSTSSEPLKVTCCFGVAQFTDQDPNGGSIMARADVALYRAKTNGRNRVELDESA